MQSNGSFDIIMRPCYNKIVIYMKNVHYKNVAEICNNAKMAIISK